MTGYWQIDNMLNPQLEAEGYTPPVSKTNELVVWMNIGVPGRTGHDFENRYDKDIKVITWFGKPGTHSKQPIFAKLKDGKLKGHFFARWNQNDPDDFSYLGVGEILNVEDGHLTKTSAGDKKETVKITLLCEDSDHILLEENSEDAFENNFALEKHLEEFIVENWKSLELGKKYDLQEDEVDGKRKKYRTDTGEIDIFAISKDRKEYLVIELKRGRASDPVIGQITRYIGYIESEIANPDQKVKGLIIALEDDLKLRRSLQGLGSKKISFNRYKIKFDLVPT